MSKTSIPPLSGTRNAQSVAMRRNTISRPISRSRMTTSVRKPGRFSTAGSADDPGGRS